VGSPIGGMLMHYGGVIWAETNTIGNDLYGVWGSSASDVFFVGDSGTILHHP